MAQAKVWSVEEVRTLIATNDKMVERSLLKLFERQTADEQSSEATNHVNHRGFNKMDAKFGTSLAKVVDRGFHLSPKQMEAARKMLRKYSAQLTLVANNGVTSSVSVSASVSIPVQQANFGFEL